MDKPIIAALCLLATPAHAIDCAPLQEVIAALASGYGEYEVARAMEDRGPMVQVYASAKGTWTMIMVTPDGRACFLASGDRWMQLAQGDLN